MARSRRKTPILPHTSAASDKQDKRLAHGQDRAAVRDALKAGEPEPADRNHPRSGTHEFSKDGKAYRADAKGKDLRK